MTQFYEIQIKNRLVKGLFSSKPIKGTQGQWYEESLYLLADSEQAAEEMAKQQVKDHRKFRISGRRKERAQIRRQIEIINVRRIA